MPLNRVVRHIFAMLALVVAVTGCDVERRTAPDYPNTTQLSQTSTDEIKLVREALPIGMPSLSISRVVGSEGGTIRFAGHSVFVPAGAVTVPTIITMTLPTNGYLEVDVQAVIVDLFGRHREAGHSFQKPIILALTYSRATNVTDPSKLFIAHMPDGTHHEHVPLVSTVSEDHQVVFASLKHLSRYCMGQN